MQHGLNRAAVADCITDARQAIVAVAIENNLEPRDYACTLIGAVINPGRSLFFQIGDGAIVISRGKALVSSLYNHMYEWDLACKEFLRKESTDKRFFGNRPLSYSTSATGVEGEWMNTDF